MNKPPSADADHAASDVGTRMRMGRNALGYSIDDLALTCGLTSAEIVAIESGSDDNPARLKRIAAVLKVALPAA